MNTAIATTKVNTARVTEIFLAAFHNATQVEFSSTWANGTGYYNGAVAGPDAPKLEVGQMVAANSPTPNDRKIIIIGTPLGNLVVFQRYSGGEGDTHVFNSSIVFNKHVGARMGKPLTADDMDYVMGDHRYPEICPNIGEKLQDLATAMAAFTPDQFRTC